MPSATMVRRGQIFGSMRKVQVRTAEVRAATTEKPPSPSANRDHSRREAVTAEPDELRAHRLAKRRKLLIGAVVAKLAIAGGVWMFTDTGHVATDNAYVGADAAQVTPLVAGPVATVEVVNTQAVKRGDVLFRLDDTDARLALAKAEAEWNRVRRQYRQAVATSRALGAQVAAGDADISSARAQVAIASSAYEKARVDLDRRSALADSGAVSGEELTASRNAWSAASGNLAQARAGLAQATAARHAAILLARQPVESLN